MRISIQVQELLHASTYAASVVDKKAIKPILTHLCLRAEVDENGQGILKISGASMTISVMMSIGAIIEEAGVITVHAYNFLDVIRKIKDNTISLVYNPETRQVDVHGKAFYSSFSTLPADDFPAFDTIQSDNMVVVPAANLLHLLIMTEYAVFNDDGRYNMSCVFLNLTKDQQLTAVAIDGHRFSIAKDPIEVVSEIDTSKTLEKAQSNTANISLLLPRRLLGDLIKMLKDSRYSSSNITLKFDNHKIMIVSRDLVMISKLVDAEFLAYESLLPDDYTSKLAIRSDILSEVVDRVSAITNDTARAVKVSQKSDVINISAYGETKGLAKETLINTDNTELFTYEGPESEYIVNPRYVLDVLRNLQTQEIEVCIGDEKQICIKPSLNPKDIFVIMPLD